ncbi:PREDICTED: thioredoxin-like protein 1 [Rhagoletis zephyria]|uniref:thioredoxin-like protein 1 n=1 Tax=Rhagoletis zephyria TaxID=28612 RepID=UPI000811323B|nr:PREDICTED: thioredoxin-like protein 1 [Rhagoletis zephyria]XP_036337848.1 thioredoxin-like protein 1 [Rhagoletis pomonella]
MSVRVINDDVHFQAELSSAGIRLVVVDFTASWCGPCQRIAPHFELLPNKYPKAIFLKVDVDKCQDTAASQGVSAMPTFIFYRNRAKIDRVQGADIMVLEGKIQEHIGSTGGDEAGEDYGQGLMELNTFISKQECECLNEADDHCLNHCLTSNGGYLQSDCDEQLILSVTFNQLVKIHSLKFKAPPHLGPKEIKLFINQPRTIDFDMAESMTSVQDLTLEPKELESGQPVSLRYVKFQNVQNIQIYIRNNQSGGEVTQLDYIGFIGSPIMTTKMTDFKRVAGKKGESH